MLSSVAVMDTSSLEFCIMFTEATFCSSSIVGLNLSNWLLSSGEGSEAAIILLVGDLNAAFRPEMGRKPRLTHKDTEY